MKALVYTAPARLELQEWPRPSADADEVVIHTAAVGICGSDLDGFLGRSKLRIPPLVLGHEFSGTVENTGPNVQGIEAGRRVAVYPLLTCGICEYCRSGREQLCPQRRVYGLNLHGALAEYVRVPVRSLFSLPDRMSLTVGALIEPLANAVHVLSQCGLEYVPTQHEAARTRREPDARPPKRRPAAGDPAMREEPSQVKAAMPPERFAALRLAVIGAGPIGAFVTWAASVFGIRKIAITDINPHRLALAKQLGAQLIVDAAANDPVAAILDWTGSEGADFVVDAVGRAQCRQQSVASTRRGGTAAWTGLADDNAAIATADVVRREVTIRGCYAYSRADFQLAIEILSNHPFPAESIVSEAELTQGQQVFDELTGSNCRKMKVVFRMPEDS